MYNYSTEELITDALAQVNDGMYSYGQALALIAIAKSLAVIADKLAYTHPPSYHTADDEERDRL